MCNPSLTDLVGRSFVARIGEPWDFCSIAGENCLRGIISDAWIKDGEPLVLCEVLPFKKGGINVTQVLLVNRYCKDQDMVASLAHGSWTAVNILYRPGAISLCRTSAEALLGNENAFNFLVGSVKIDQ